MPRWGQSTPHIQKVYSFHQTYEYTNYQIKDPERIEKIAVALEQLRFGSFQLPCVYCELENSTLLFCER